MIQEYSTHREVGLSDEEALTMYEIMLQARRLDERMWLLNRAGKISFVVSCQGQEAAQAAAAMALDRDKDYLLPYYRDFGLVMAFGMTAKDLMLAAFAKQGDPNSESRQMPGHFGQRKNRIVTQSSPVTTQIPHAAGFGLAAKMKNKDFVTMVTFGEGSSNQGDFHEGMNFAGVHDLPVVFFCENNKYAISVPLSKQLACEHVADRAKGYGMPGVTVEGTRPFEVYKAMKEAVDRARDGKGPSLVEALVARLTPHSSDDNDKLYRSVEEMDEEKQTDAVVAFADYLRTEGILTEEKEQAMEQRIREEVDAATDAAEAAEYPAVETLGQYVYEEEGN